MRALWSHPRFWLFAPFIGLALMAVLGFALWQMTASRLVDTMGKTGLTWQHIERHGFPARISLNVTAARFARGDLMWQNPEFSVTMMPFQAGHAIVDFKQAHILATKKARLTIAHKGNLASLIGDGDGLARASVELNQARLALTQNGPKHIYTADKIGLHARRHTKPAHYETALTVKQLILPPQLGQAAAAPIARFDVAGIVPEALLENSPAAGQIVQLDRLTMQRGALTLIARGKVKLAPTGDVQGRLDLEAIRLDALMDMLEEFAIISPRERQKWLFLSGLGAALAGQTQDRISVPLIFKGGRTSIGPLDVGPAPRWQDN